MDIPLDRALNAVWYYLSKDGSQKGIAQLKADLMRPLPGMADVVSDEVVSHELAMFAAAMQQQLK